MLHHTVVVRLFWLCFSFFLFHFPAGAQQLECVSAPEEQGACVVRVPAAADSAVILLRLTPVPRSAEPVEFRLQSGTGSVTSRASTLQGGYVEARWRGTASSTPTTLVAQAQVGERAIRREIRIQAAALGADWALRAVSGRDQIWYERRQLPQPIVVEIVGPGEDCAGAGVLFRTLSGSVSVDSVHARPEERGPGRPAACVARTYWRLGEGVGVHDLTVTLRGQPERSLLVSARGRALPRIGVGLAGSWVRPHAAMGVNPADDLVPLRTGDAFFISPTVTADFPLLRGVTGLRGSAGVSLTSPQRDWYLGASALQPFYGLRHEALGVDMHVVAHFGRRVVPVNFAACEAGTDCTTRDRFLILGVGPMFVVDGVSLLQTFANLMRP